MDIRVIKRKLARTPWVPFEFVLEDGECVRVRRPENIFVVSNIDIIVIEDKWQREFGPEAVTQIRRPRRNGSSRQA